MLIVTIVSLLIVCVCLFAARLLYIYDYNIKHNDEYIFNNLTLEFEPYPLKEYFKFNRHMKINDIVTWNKPMNQAEENDKMLVIDFYGDTRVLVKHLNEHENTSTEKISDLKFLKHKFNR